MKSAHWLAGLSKNEADTCNHREMSPALIQKLKETTFLKICLLTKFRDRSRNLSIDQQQQICILSIVGKCKVVNMHAEQRCIAMPGVGADPLDCFGAINANRIWTGPECHATHCRKLLKRSSRPGVPPDMNYPGREKSQHACSSLQAGSA